MKYAVFVAALAVIICAPGARAQDYGNHGEVGAFADYFRMQQTGTNFVGLGGRVGFGMPHVQIEAEMAYDFNQAFTEGFNNTSGSTVTTVNSNYRVLHGLFGPKFQTKGPVRVFATVKGGFTNFSFSPTPASVGTFTSTVNNLRTNDVSAAFYPGAGVEGFLGPVGLRVDVGDEMIFTDGVHHNWKITFGPVFRF